MNAAKILKKSQKKEFATSSLLSENISGTLKDYQLPTYATTNSAATESHYFFGPGHGGTNPALAIACNNKVYSLHSLLVMDQLSHYYATFCNFLKIFKK